jgi:hypothetical protein
MLFTDPMPFAEAVNAAKVRSLLPTSGKTADLQRLGSEVKRRALFSATVETVTRLQSFRDGIDRLIDGDTDQATVRAELKQMLQKDGYLPDPEKAGGLQDLSSDKRLNLILETNVQTAQGLGWYQQGLDPAVLDEWPAQELYRAFSTGKQREWPERWQRAGGRFYDGRMIALKDDPVWKALGDPGLFPDALGNPYPPFAFNSGMDVQDISRDEAMSLGLIDADTQVSPDPIDMSQDLSSSAEIRDAALKDAVESSGLGFWENGVFHFDSTGGDS